MSEQLSKESRDRSGAPLKNYVSEPAAGKVRNDSADGQGLDDAHSIARGGSLRSLDSMLKPSECAAWLRISKRELGENTTGHNPKIPAFSLGHKTKRFHPRTILAVLAKRSGVPLETIAASYGIQETKGQQ